MDKRIYNLREFSKADKLEREESGIRESNHKKINISTVKQLSSVDELDKYSVNDRIKVLVVQGTDPYDPNKYPSRSEALFDCVCQLLRAKVPDEVVYSVLTDKGFGISSSVLDKKNPKYYAERQIKNGKEHVEHPKLRELNVRHAVIRNLGGKCRIIEEVYDPILKRPKLTKQSFQDFQNGYMHTKVVVMGGKGKPIEVPLGRWWLNHPMRRQYANMVFAPEKESEDCYNLWRGFQCEAIEGDCGLFLNHIKDNICDGVDRHYNYLICWMARAVQKPDSPGETAVVLRGKQGTGKSFFAKTFGSLWGRHFLQISNPKHLTGSFNAHLRDCVVLFADEAFYAGDKKHESILKTLVTEETFEIEYKGVDMEIGPNFTHIILGSNSDWVVPVSGEDRRYFVLDVAATHMRDYDYFDKLSKQINSGGREALLYHLKNLDLTQFQVRDVPKTKALQDQKLHSMTNEEEWWYNKLEKGLLLDENVKWESSIACEKIITDYIEYSKSFNIFRRGNETLLGRFLKKINPKGYPQKRKRRTRIRIRTDEGDDVEVDRLKYHYIFPSIGDCRLHWESLFGPADWPEIEYGDDEIINKDIPF
jgi:hypothetical protein